MSSIRPWKVCNQDKRVFEQVYGSDFIETHPDLYGLMLVSPNCIVFCITLQMSQLHLWGRRKCRLISIFRIMNYMSVGRIYADTCRDNTPVIPASMNTGDERL